MYHVCPWQFWLKPKFTEDKLSVFSVEAKLTQFFKMKLSCVSYVSYVSVASHEEYEYPTCILSLSKGEANADF